MNVFTTPVVVVDTVFLRVYAKGAVSLYYYKDENLKNHFYVDKNGSEPEELIRRRSLTEQGQLATVEKYKGQLAFLLSDCPKSAKAAERTPFQLSKLQKLVLDYNACGSGVADPSGNYAKQIEKVKWVLGVVGGFTSTKVKFSGFPPSINDLRFEPARSLVVGPSLEIVLPRRRRQYSFYNELIYKPYQTIAPNPRLSLPSRFSLDVAYVKIMTTFRWRYASGRVRPFANVGIGNSFAIRAKTNVIQETRSYEQSLVGGAGVTFRRLGAELRYEAGNGTSPYSTLKSPTRSVYLLVGYQF